jgi:hypothetical protein
LSRGLQVLNSMADSGVRPDDASMKLLISTFVQMGELAKVSGRRGLGREASGSTWVSLAKNIVAGPVTSLVRGCFYLGPQG